MGPAACHRRNVSHKPVVGTGVTGGAIPGAQLYTTRGGGSTTTIKGLSLSLLEKHRCKACPLRYKREGPSSSHTSTLIVTHLKQYYDQYYTVVGCKPELV
jgi:hypothetical protein